MIVQKNTFLNTLQRYKKKLTYTSFLTCYARSFANTILNAMLAMTMKEMSNKLEEGYDINEVISYSIELINKIGYFNSNSNYPTKYMVREMLERENINKRINATKT